MIEWNHLLVPSNMNNLTYIMKTASFNLQFIREINIKDRGDSILKLKKICNPH